MKVLVTEVALPKGMRWQVRMDQHVVSFRSEAEAQAFVATLQARLSAPHRLPASQQAAG